MIYYYINNTDRSGDIKEQSLTIDNQLQQRTDQAYFTVFQGTKPSENQNVRIFKGDKIVSAVGAVITLKGYFQRNVGIFYAGQKLHIRINDADEEIVEVLSYVESTLTLTLVSAPTGVISVDDKIGEIIFGGVVSRVEDSNVDVLQNLEYDITCVDYLKIVDKKLISDTWESRDSRYIINDICNNFINYNHELDQMDYATNGDIQGEWIESGAGANPTTDDTSPYEADHWGVFLNNTGASATWEASPASSNVSFFTGANTGTPTQGKIGFWIKIDDITKVSTLKVRVGSSSGNYAESGNSAIIDQVTANNTPFYIELDLLDMSITGVPDWTACDYLAFVCTGTASYTFKVAGIRLLQDYYFKHYPYVYTTAAIDDIRSPQLKVSALLQLLAKTFEYVWWVDYDRYIHFEPISTSLAPFQITNTSNNFTDLSIEVDQSQLGNRIIVRGGTKPSDNLYSQVFQGNNVLREWLMKNEFLFSGFTIKVDNNSTTHAAEVGTTTTNIKITGHGLSTGDHVVNRTRGVVRQITKVDNDNFTVEIVTAQTNGDTISYFSVSKTLGIDGVSDPTAYNYLGNQDQKSIKSVPTETTLTSSDYIRFSYYERIPIQLQYQDSASINALKVLGFGDGIFDLDPYTDRNIDSIGTALVIAQAKVTEFSNPTIKGNFETDQCGLQAGQSIRITDSYRSIDDDYVIQRVKTIIIGGKYKDYTKYKVQIGTTLFGIIEFFQKLLATQDRIELNTDEVVETYVTADEQVDCSETNSVAKEGDENAKNTETVESDDSNQSVDWTSGTWKYEPSVGQTLPTRFNLADYG
jgi:hypothetical protein